MTPTSAPPVTPTTPPTMTPTMDTANPAIHVPSRSQAFGAALTTGATSGRLGQDRPIGADIYFSRSGGGTSMTERSEGLLGPEESTMTTTATPTEAGPESVSESLSESLTESVSESLTEPTSESGVESAGESVAGSAGESGVESAGDSVAESSWQGREEVQPAPADRVHEAVAAPVDDAVDSAPEATGFTHEETVLLAGDNGVDVHSALAPPETVSRETGSAATFDQAGSVEDEATLAENTHRRIQLIGRPFPKPVHSRVLTVANQKGGVGKTTTTVNVAAALAQSGLRVLVIDLDPQGNASTALGIDHHAEVPSIYDVLVDGASLLDVVQPCTTVEDLYCAPATIDLAGAEIELVSLVARESRLQKAITAATEAGHDFDYILIDCPPSLGLLTVNAMVAATEVFIPIQCEYYALEGLSQLLKNIELVKSHLNPRLHVSTILLTMYDGRTRLSAQVADEVREHFPEQVLRTTVPRSVRVSEAPSFGETVMTYDPTSSGALAYLEAAGELADRGADGRI